MSEKKGCKSCKTNPLNKTTAPFVILGLYLLGTSIYGTYILIQNIINIFK